MKNVSRTRNLMLSFFLVDNGIIESNRIKSNRIESNQPYFEVASLIQKIKFIKLLQSNRKIWYDMVRYIMNRNRISLFIKDVNVSQSHCYILSCDTVSLFCIISSPTFPLSVNAKFTCAIYCFVPVATLHIVPIHTSLVSHSIAD